MPGNTGDLLYSLPTARVLCAAHATTCDFYTAETSKHTKRLMEYQSFIDRLIIPKAYKIERRDIGTQPYIMPIEDTYDAVYHLGYRSVPDRTLHQFIAYQLGITLPLAIHYEYPIIESPLTIPYVCIAARGETTYKAFFMDLISKLNSRGIGVAQIGGKGDFVGLFGWDATGKDMLDTLSILSHAKAFIGLMSSQLVLANGFPIPRIAPHDGIHWDMRHCVYTPLNHYPINPTTDAIIDLT